MKADKEEWSFVEVEGALHKYRFVHQSGATGKKELIEPFSSGCAVFDYDNDGDLDLYLVNGASTITLEKENPSYWNRLYRNDGNFTFVDVTEEAGVAGSGYNFGVAAGDYDNDGDRDLYVTGFQRNTLFRNEGDGTFTDVTEAANVFGGMWSTSAAFVDYDEDGFLDLYVCRYLEWEIGKGPYCGNKSEGWRSYCLPDPFPPIPDLLFRNNGDGTFTDVSRESGIDAVKGKGLGVTIGDFDLDGHVDLFVANDRHKDFLFRNQGDGSFEEIGSLAGVSYSLDGVRRAGMGTDFGDYNLDGWLDLVVTNFADEGIALFENVEGLYFNDQSGLVGVLEPSFPYVIFGVGFLDFDSDGLCDLFAVTGHILDDIERYRAERTYAGPNLLFLNSDTGFRLTEDSVRGPLSKPTVSRGAAFGDLDGDGDTDLVVMNRDSAPTILKNQAGDKRNRLLVDLVGRRSNRDAIGTQVRVEIKGRKQAFSYKSAASYLAANDPRIHVGLGEESTLERLTLVWPSGKTQEFEGLAEGYLYTISEEEGILSQKVFGSSE